jgi:hypothetical protein
VCFCDRQPAHSELGAIGIWHADCKSYLAQHTTEGQTKPMSTIMFSADELGNVARYLASTIERLRLESICDDLAIYSRGNARDYMRSYPRDTVVGHAAPEISAYAPSVIGVDNPRAIGTLRLLAYNGVEAPDDPAETIAYLGALSRILERAFYRVTER